MLTKNRLIISAALALCAIPASAGSFAYVVNGNQFGTVDLTTGAFSPIGPGIPEGVGGLAYAPNGSLLTLSFSGNLESINPATGVTSVIGATGLADCSTPASPCGPTATSTIGQLGGTVYATDLSNNLYSVNTLTGAATLIGPTGIPAVPFIPTSFNPDGTFNAYDEALFSSGGNLYATFDAINIDFSTFTVTPVIAPELYQINTSTGHATALNPTALGLGAAFSLGGTVYTFADPDSQVLALDLGTGGASLITGFDPAAGIIDGAVAATPEPGSVALARLGFVGMGYWRWMVKF